jgi:hypothetical protein
MNEQRSRENRAEQGAHNKDSGQQNRQSGLPTGFEGMNFEQRRGSYRGDTSSGINAETGNEKHSGKRHEDL